ncbi:MAG: putative cobaltochelatase, partial [Desulfosoma sp.]|uniref:putative cobaltochelatase n=1 Tax=Desulfosoma sp. TaxID=2603217 RepID=UPI004049C623
MGVFDKVYPFTALVGQEKLKKALLLNAVNPAIGGVLIRGEKGTAKSTAVRALAAVLPEIRVIRDCAYACDPERPEEWCERCRGLTPPVPVARRRISIVTLPLNATEDCVVGGIDFEDAIKTGRRQFHPGVLAKAHRGILYVDEINLLDDYIADLILDATASGWNRVEREGISFAHPARFMLVGTMNPEEGELRPQLLDRFGLCVEITAEQSLESRVELMVRRECFDTDPEGFSADFEKENHALAWSVLAARELLPKVRLPQHLRSFIPQLASEQNVAGHRADLVLEQAAKASAALAKRLVVTAEDIRDVASMVFLHRRREAVPPPPPPPPQPPKDSEEDEKSSEPSNPKEQENQKPQPPEDSRESSAQRPEGPAEEPQETESQETPTTPNENEMSANIVERIFEIGDTFRVRPLTAPKDRLFRRGSGRRSRTRTGQKQGRYVKSAQQGDGRDVALDATLRAAAPHQVKRRTELCDSSPLAVYLSPEDVRQKVREKRIGNVLVFVVDASGSMGAHGRMAATKGALMSLLVDAYQKRDRVALITFRKNEAELKLPPTSSVELGARLLRDLPVGGRTPLSAALVKSYELTRNVLLRDPTAKPLLILVTDGKANVPLGNRKPVEEALLIAERLANDGRIHPIVVDTEKMGIVQFGLAKKLAAVMNAAYFRIEDLKADTLVRIVKEVME